jgi:hypothetical protein
LSSLRPPFAAFGPLKERARRDGRVHLAAKPLTDYLLVRALEIAERQGLPVQFHTGFGDADLDLREATPLHLRPLFESGRYARVPFVLLHASYPYVRELGYLAAIYPNVYADVGLAVPHLAAEVPAMLRQLLGIAPTTKVVYSSDASQISELRTQILALPPGDRGVDDAPLAAEWRSVAAFKQAALMVVGTALQTHGDALPAQQEVLSFAADILIDTYACESATARATAALAAGGPLAPWHEAAARVSVHDAAARVDLAARTALAATAEGDTLRTLLAALRRVLKPAPVDTVTLRRTLADAVTARGRYILE